MVDIIDNLILMGLAASIIAVLMMLVAWIGKGVFSGMWYQTAWIIAMLLLVIPMYWLIGSLRVQPDSFANALIPAGFREGYVRFMDRPIGDLAGLNADAGIVRSIAGVSIRTTLFVLWGLGVAVLVAWKLIRYYTFRNSIIKKSVPSDERWIFAIPDEIRSKIKLRDAAIPSPFVFGIFHPTVVMPAHAENKEDICFALMHELLHIERKDLLTKTIAESVAVLHWFNPFAWIIRNKVTLACENACDEAVAEKLNEDGRKGYAMAILDFMDYSAAPEPDYPPTLMSFSGDADHVKTRLKNIMRYRKMSRAVLAVSVGVILIVLSAGILAGFTLSLSVRSVRAEIRDDPSSTVTPVSDPSETTVEVSETVTPEPTPITASYSNALGVFSKGDWTIVTGPDRFDEIPGVSGVSDSKTRYSADRGSVAFLAGDSDSRDTVLFFSKGNKPAEIARNVIDLALSDDGRSLVYETKSDSNDNVSSLFLYRTDTGETSILCSDCAGSFAISPGARAVGYTSSADGAIRVIFPGEKTSLTPDVAGDIVALSDSGDILYFVREEAETPAVYVQYAGKTFGLIREEEDGASGFVRLILSTDRTDAVLISGGRVIVFIDGNKTVQLENVSDIALSSDTRLSGRETLPGGLTISVEERKDDTTGRFAIFAFESKTGQSRGVSIGNDGMSTVVSVPGKVLAVSSDGFRILYRSEEGAIYLADGVFDGWSGDSIHVDGSVSNAEHVAFAEDRSVYYLTDDGQMNRISETGKPARIASDVSEFALISVNGRTELFYLSDYKEEWYDLNGQGFKRYGRSLFSAKHESVTFSLLVDEFVFRLYAGPYGVFYERVTHAPSGSSGCVASVDIYFSTNGEEFTRIKQIG